MNKTQLVDALAARIGDRSTAATAVDGMLETIVNTVGAGESVSITGFGVFESRARAARVARNPRTGETVDVPATTVPAFRPGVGFRTKVGGANTPPARPAPVRKPRVAAAKAVTAVAEKPVRMRAKAGTGFAAEKQDPAGKATAAKAPAAKAPAEKVTRAKPAKAKPAEEKPRKARVKR